MKNHLDSDECKLCLTLHNNEGSYLAHTQGKKHQGNLARRAAKEAKEAPSSMQSKKARIEPQKLVKIDRPGYRVTKQRDSDNGQQSLQFQIDYPEITGGIIPWHRCMSAYEQKVEPPDRKWQYLLFAAEPYEMIVLKVPGQTGHQAVLPAVFVQVGTEDNSTTSAEYGNGITSYVSNKGIEVD